MRLEIIYLVNSTKKFCFVELKKRNIDSNYWVLKLAKILNSEIVEWV